jgi:hypothetical protein
LPPKKSLFVAEDCHAGDDLECPGTPGLGNPQLRLERPAIVAEVEQLAVVVLSKWRGNLKAHANDEILPVAGEVLHRQRGGSKRRQWPVSTNVLIGKSSAWIRSSNACTNPTPSTTCKAIFRLVLVSLAEISS